MSLNIAVIGSSGAIGTAMTSLLASRYKTASIHAFSRRGQDSPIAGVHYHPIDYQEETSIKQAAKRAAQDTPLDLVFVAIGQLHDGDIVPEKSLRDLSERNFQHLFQSNAIIPALLAKHFLPELNRQNRSVFAALSARVGSISDNRLGGWYAYRASKAALNMIIKNAAIETARRNKQALIVGLHPGTVDSDLSKPFQKAVPDGKLFTPDFSAQKLLTILETLTSDQSGKCFAWDGQEIAP